jgi:hypothetical protein
MRDFFRGWKRKLGVVTLGLACLFAAGWVKSYSAQDIISMSFNHHSIHELISASGWIVIHRKSSTVRSNGPIMRPAWVSGDSGFPSWLPKSESYFTDCGVQIDRYVAFAWIT